MEAIVTHQTIHYGDLVITKDNAKEYANLWQITGCLDVQEGVTFIAPALAEVFSSIYVQKGATFIAPTLAKSDYIDVQQGATFIAPTLTQSGSIYIDQEAIFTAPALAQSNRIYVRKKAILTAPALEKSGSVHVREGATFIAPALNPEIELFREISEFSGRILFASKKGNYRSGCKGPWSAAVCKEMASELGEEYGEENKKQFLSAIKKHEAEIKGVTT